MGEWQGEDVGVVEHDERRESKRVMGVEGVVGACNVTKREEADLVVRCTLLGEGRGGTWILDPRLGLHDYSRSWDASFGVVIQQTR